MAPKPLLAPWGPLSARDELLRGSGNHSAPAHALRITPRDARNEAPPSAVAIRVSACFEELRGPVCGYLATFCRRPEEAEELMQESFLRLFAHLAAGNDLEDEKAWLFRVSHNLAINHLKRRGSPPPPDDYTEPAATEPSPETRMLEKERSLGLRAAIHNLTDHQRRVLYLRAEGLRYREIAETLEISVSSVVDTIARAVERLRKTSDGSY
ncbi:MAG: sigma-70 family RNA polymerase sigma factor [Bryobacteraceae bacterium]